MRHAEFSLRSFNFRLGLSKDRTRLWYAEMKLNFQTIKYIIIKKDKMSKFLKITQIW